MFDNDTNKKNLFSELATRELDMLAIVLSAAGDRTSISIKEYISLRLLQGISRDAIKAELLTDLKEGGRIFGEFKNALNAAVAGSINRFRDSAEFTELEIEKEYRWVAVMVNTCPDCVERHGKVKKWEDWEAEGLPRTGHTVCRQHCRCVLLPVETTVLAEPIKIPRKS